MISCLIPFENPRRPILGPRALLELRREHWQQRARGWPRRLRERSTRGPDAISFRFKTSFDGFIFVEAKRGTLRLYISETPFGLPGRGAVRRTIRLSPARRGAFWREVTRLGVWRWRRDTQIYGLDGSSFDLTLRHGRLRVTAGWWVGRPGRRLLYLCRALDRLTIPRIVDFVKHHG